MTSATGAVLIRVERRGGRSVVTRCSGAAPVAPRIVTGDRADWAQVVLVSSIAGPLAGDRVSLEVEVGAGARLDLRSAAATIAYPAAGRHHERSSQRMRCTVGTEGRLRWRQAELVLVSGSRHESLVELHLESGGAAVVEETVIGGRHGEPGGSLVASMHCNLDGRPLLREGVIIEPKDPVTTSVVVLGGARVYGSVSLLGLSAVSENPGELRLAGTGCLLRAIADDALAVSRRLARARHAYLARLAMLPGPAAAAIPRCGEECPQPAARAMLTRLEMVPGPVR